MFSLTTITALCFCSSIVATYLAVRLHLVSIPVALIVGFMVNSLAFFVFAIARDNGLDQALLVGLLQGTIFTTASITMGAFFREASLTESTPAMDYASDQLSTAA